MVWYDFRQNNSGGSFDYQPGRGVSVNVIIEANSHEEAIDRAESIGLYFDGSGDCSCCGDRWSDYESTTDDVPEPDAPLIQNDRQTFSGMKWVDGYETFVHPLEGEFYGAHKEVKVINPHIYGKINGYGVRGNSNWVSKAFAVNEDGWDEQGMQQAPSPTAKLYFAEEEPEQIGDVRIQGGNSIDDTYFAAWFPKKKQAEEFSKAVDKYQKAHVFDVRQFLS